MEDDRILTVDDLPTQSDAIFAIDIKFKCQKCGGNIVWTGTKQCYPCSQGGMEDFSSMLSMYQPKNLTGKNFRGKVRTVT